MFHFIKTLDGRTKLTITITKQQKNMSKFKHAKRDAKKAAYAERQEKQQKSDTLGDWD